MISLTMMTVMTLMDASEDEKDTLMHVSETKQSWHERACPATMRTHGDPEVPVGKAKLPEESALCMLKQAKAFECLSSERCKIRKAVPRRSLPVANSLVRLSVATNWHDRYVY